LKKLDSKRYGPFRVIEKIGISPYKLELPWLQKGVHAVFNEVLVQPYLAPTSEIQLSEPKPIPELVEREKEFEVEEILDAVLKVSLLCTARYKAHLLFLGCSNF